MKQGLVSEIHQSNFALPAAAATTPISDYRLNDLKFTMIAAAFQPKLVHLTMILGVYSYTITNEDKKGNKQLPLDSNHRNLVTTTPPSR